MTPKELKLQTRLTKLETRHRLLLASCKQDHELLERVANIIRPSVDELHRRALLEAEIAETMSYQRHRIDKAARLLSDLHIRILDLELPWYTKVARAVRAWFR